MHFSPCLTSLIMLLSLIYFIFHLILKIRGESGFSFILSYGTWLLIFLLVWELIFAIRLHLHSFVSNHILCRISMLNFWKTIRQKAVEVALDACKRIVRRNLFSRDNGSHTIQIMVQVIKKFLFRPICTSWPEVCCCALLSNVSIAESSGWLFRNCFALCVCVPFKHLLMSV